VRGTNGDRLSQSTLEHVMLHEFEHLANDWSDPWGNLNPPIPSDINERTRVLVDRDYWKNNHRSAAYGFWAEWIQFGTLQH
jgi:hypothetical protein